MRNKTEIVADIMDHLLDTYGVLETEVFISEIKRGEYDYTEWQKNQFRNADLHDFLEDAADYVNRNKKISAPVTGE